MILGNKESKTLQLVLLAGINSLKIKKIRAMNILMSIGS